MLWKIGLGALLHDIGKLFIPISIVAKQRPLNPYETQVMKQHCELGEHVLTGRGLDTVCLKIVRQHHERLDGSGYPDGLRGSEIADEAKIVMIADSIDAITSYRPYKKAHSIAEAMKRLEKDSGQYDVKLFPVIKAFFFNQ
jgi:HD-GYP domain-containing protein (c-di-GMP phosphodiesterase class II)